MDEFPNINPAKWSMNYSFTQPYTGWKSANKIYDEIIRLDAIDNIVQHMLTYPDAERILNKIKEKPND